MEIQVMMALIFICFYLAVIAHVVAASAVAGYIRGQRAETMLAFAQRLTLVGVVLLLTTLCLRYALWQRIPLSTSVDALSLFVLLSSCTALFVSRGDRRALLAVYLPPLGGLAAMAGIAGFISLDESPKPLSGALLVTHVGLVFLAFSLFFVASLTSFAYLGQSRRLKRQTSDALYAKLPSLENLDKTLYRLIQVGYPVFAVALALGMYWAWTEHDLLTAEWWMSPKIILSFCMGAVVSICFHARRRGWLRGPKLARFLFVGVGMVLGPFVLLRLLEVINLNFFKEAG